MNTLYHFLETFTNGFRIEFLDILSLAGILCAIFVIIYILNKYYLFLYIGISNVLWNKIIIAVFIILLFALYRLCFYVDFYNFTFSNIQEGLIIPISIKEALLASLFTIFLNYTFMANYSNRIILYSILFALSIAALKLFLVWDDQPLNIYNIWLNFNKTITFKDILYTTGIINCFKWYPKIMTMIKMGIYNVDTVGGPPVGGPPLGGPPVGGPSIGGPSVGGPPVGGNVDGSTVQGGTKTGKHSGGSARPRAKLRPLLPYIPDRSKLSPINKARLASYKTTEEVLRGFKLSPGSIPRPGTSVLPGSIPSSGTYSVLPGSIPRPGTSVLPGSIPSSGTYSVLPGSIPSPGTSVLPGYRGPFDYSGSFTRPGSYSVVPGYRGPYDPLATINTQLAPFNPGNKLNSTNTADIGNPHIVVEPVSKPLDIPAKKVSSAQPVIEPTKAANEVVEKSFEKPAVNNKSSHRDPWRNMNRIIKRK